MPQKYPCFRQLDYRQRAPANEVLRVSGARSAVPARGIFASDPSIEKCFLHVHEGWLIVGIGGQAFAREISRVENFC